MNHSILVTGAGGAAAVSIIKALEGARYRIIAADMDRHAAGLYLVEPADREILPAASDQTFVLSVLEACLRHRVDVVIPTVDSELIPIARARASFEKRGIRVMSAGRALLETVLDKAALVERLCGVIPTPRTVVLDSPFEASSWRAGVVSKPRRGAGSRGITMLTAPTAHDLRDLPLDGSMILQELLPGAEYSVDVLADAEGCPLAAVPRERMKVDSGVAVTSRTLRDTDLESFAFAAVRELGLPWVSNVQFRRDADGCPKLLEINPRFPGTMPLTVASGVNMPLLALRAILGAELPEGPMPFEEVAVVRYWTERYIGPDELISSAQATLAA